MNTRNVKENSETAFHLCNAVLQANYFEKDKFRYASMTIVHNPHAHKPIIACKRSLNMGLHRCAFLIEFKREPFGIPIDNLSGKTLSIMRNCASSYTNGISIRPC